MFVYASPPLTGLNLQFLAKCGHQWPHFLSSLPVPTSQSPTLLSIDPLTSCPASVGLNWTQRTLELPLSQMLVLLVTVLRLSPARATRTQNAVTCGPSSTWVRSCLCADEMDAPICGPSREDMTGGPVFNAAKFRVKARRFPSSRSICTAGVAKVPANC